MKRLIILILLVSVVASGVSVVFTQQQMRMDKPSAGATVSPVYVIVDDFKGVSTYRDWYYTCIGTDRGEMGSGSYAIDIGGGTASVTVQSGWAGVWTSLIHKGSQNEEIDPAKLLGPYIKSQYQPYITGIEIDIIEGSGQFKIELKNGSDNVVANSTFTLTGGARTLEYSITPTANLSKLNWVVDGAGSAVVDEVRLVIQSPDYSAAEAVFLFSYGHLSQCYDETSGLVRDRARWPVEDFAAVQTIGTFALATAIAWDLGYVETAAAAAIIQKTKNTVLNLPKHEKGLLPHFLTNGDITEETEWSSVDTVITLIAEILACEAIGEDTSQLEAILTGIDWADLTASGTHSIGMGYGYDGQKLQTSWDTFGSEALLAAVAYCASTGDNNVKLEKFDHPPTWDGSGFNDEMAALFFPIQGFDIWGNDWDAYRTLAFENQSNFLLTHQPYGTEGLFGLSACEVPEPWTMEYESDIYKAWGIGGHNNTPDDGTDLVGYPVIAPHYAAMIAAENPDAFENLFLYLIDTRGIFTPLNNVESFGIHSSGNVYWNSLKGSWNLSLQALGAGRALSNSAYLPYEILSGNNFLYQGYTGIMGTSISITFPSGKEKLEVGSSRNITWNSTGTVDNVRIEYSTNNGDTWTEIAASTPNDGSHLWTVPGTVSSRCLVRVSDVDGMPSDTSNAVFRIFQAAVNVTSPDGGEVWEVNSEQTITWNTTGTVDNVKIEYSIDNGGQWTEIAASIENTGSFAWTVPDTPSNQCLVRVGDTDGTPSDASDKVFTIVSNLSITVLSPNGGETLFVGTVKNIDWASSGTVEYVKIEYSTDNGSQWIEITPSTENDNSYSWTVPDAVSALCLIRVSDTGGTPSDVSDNVFSIQYTPTITVTSPNGGENLETGSNQTITWTDGGSATNVTIEYSIDGGTSWTPIVESTSNDGSFNWTVPGKPSGDCLVRVGASDSDSGPTDTSDAVFSIVSPSSDIVVTSPNGGESLSMGSIHQITWTSVDPQQVPEVTIEYSFDREKTWIPIAVDIPNTANGSFDWTVPGTSSDYCFVRVRGSKKDDDPSDTSDNAFSILPWEGLLLLSPNGGEIIRVGDVYTITWTSAGNRVDEIKVEVSWDGGESWLGIHQYAANTGSLPWLVDIPPSDNCLIRLYSMGFTDTSDAVFSVVAVPTITVTAPNGGESWEAGTTQTVTWTWTGKVGNVTLDYSTDSGETWTEISESEPNTGSYDWTIPETLSNACLLRVTSKETDSEETVTDQSDSVFSITAAQTASVTVTAPNGGELLFPGETHTVTWNSTGSVGDIAIDYSIDGGQAWEEVVPTTGNDGSYDWTVPDNPSANCLVRVRAAGGGPQDVSDNPFTILSPAEGSVTVTVPNGGETWLAGSVHDIQWSSTGTVNNVSIQYSVDNGITWSTVVDSTGNDGSYSWTVPDTPSGDCLIRVKGIEGDWDDHILDVSDAPFSILADLPRTFTLIYPNGGETLISGTTARITWDSTGDFDEVVLEYSLNGGELWFVITETAADTGEYNWQVPALSSSNCLVRISGVMSDSDEEVSDASDSFFTIVEN